MKKNKTRNIQRRAQIQMGENVIILFIFFILLIFAVVFFTKLRAAKTQQQEETDVTGRGLQIAQKVAFFPEFQCTKDNAEIFPGCYDEFSLNASHMLSQREENREYYSVAFGFSFITIQKIFPIKSEPMIIYNNTKEKWSSIITTHMPIALCNFIDSSFPKGDCSFAVLKVGVYN